MQRLKGLLAARGRAQRGGGNWRRSDHRTFIPGHRIQECPTRKWRSGLVKESDREGGVRRHQGGLVYGGPRVWWWRRREGTGGVERWAGEMCALAPISQRVPAARASPRPSENLPMLTPARARVAGSVVGGAQSGRGERVGVGEGRGGCGATRTATSNQRLVATARISAVARMVGPKPQNWGRTLIAPRLLFLYQLTRRRAIFASCERKTSTFFFFVLPKLCSFFDLFRDK